MAVFYDKDNDVKLEGALDISAAPKFDQAGLKPRLVALIQKAFNSNKPTPIQKYSIPAIIRGLDVIGLSETGSGKTGAYLIPIVNGLLTDFTPPPKGSRPEVLILAPTRELALQIKCECDHITNRTMIISASIYGGENNKAQQKKEITKGAHIVTATPGRLLKYLSNYTVNFENIRTVVIDEADHMTEANFLTDLYRIFNCIPRSVFEKMQLLMYSATTTPIMEKFAFQMGMKENAEVMDKGGNKEPMWLSIEKGIIGRANPDILQTILEVPHLEKTDMLLKVLTSNPQRALIFVRTIERSKSIFSSLKERDFNVEDLSSNFLQSDREEKWERFKAGEIQFLVCTDLACRGLHVSELPHVVNYDMPQFSDKSQRIRDYVHRIGRTGRMGAKGLATSFFDPGQDGVLGPELYLQLLALGHEVPAFLHRYEREATRDVPKKVAAFSRKSRPKKKKRASATAPNKASDVITTDALEKTVADLKL